MPDPLARFGTISNTKVAFLVSSFVDALVQIRAAHEVFATTAGPEEASEIRVLTSFVPQRLTSLGHPWHGKTDDWDDWVLNALVSQLHEVSYGEDPHGDAPQ